MAPRLTYVIASAVLVLAEASPVARAQEPTRVQGLVTNDTRQPLSGVSVGIGSLGVGAFTGDDGRYTFTIPAGRGVGQQVSLTARRIGLQPVAASINLGAGTITKDFVLSTSPTQLEGVVVTALGITREKSQLGTAMQQVDQEELNRTHDQNIMNPAGRKSVRVERYRRRHAGWVDESHDPRSKLDSREQQSVVRRGRGSGVERWSRRQPDRGADVRQHVRQ